MKASKSIIHLVLFAFSLFTATSCLEGKGNYQSVNNVVGSIVILNGSKYFRSDNGDIFKAPEFDNFQEYNRIIASFTINYDQQVSNTYQIVTNVAASKFPLYNINEISETEPDTFNNDAIANAYHYVSKLGTYTYLTVQPQFYASNANHRFALVYNAKDPKVSESDTLKVELRHNKKGDTNTSTWGTYLMSFDLTPYLEYRQSKVIRIKFNITSSDSIVYYKVSN